MTTDPHARYRTLLPFDLAEALGAEDAAWMSAHTESCAVCRELRSRVHDRLAVQAGDHAGHAPAGMLSAWLHDPALFTPLERELLRRHLSACDTCHSELTEMAAFAHLPVTVPPSARHDWRGPAIAGLLAAAALVGVFFVGTHEPGGLTPSLEHTPLPVSGTIDKAGPGAGGKLGSPTSGVPVRITFPERMRGDVTDSLVIGTLTEPTAALKFRLPPMFLEPGSSVRIVVERSLGHERVFDQLVPATRLATELELRTISNGWQPGEYRLRLLPDSGRDSTATRVFEFRLVRGTR